MRRICFVVLLLVALSVDVCELSAQTSHKQLNPHQQETWYEFVLRQFNPSGFDYGAWVEHRRQAFLEATVRTRYFWYSFSVTAVLLLVFAAYTKLRIDHRRSLWVTSEMMADLYNHDFYSRQIAKEAIEKYNRHIEQCNRAIEQAESGEGRPGWGDTQAEIARKELQRVTGQLEATLQDRDKLQVELKRKSLVIADLTIRGDAFAKKAGNGQSGPGVTSVGSIGGSAADTKLIEQINRLQEELYGERQKNKRLKGA
jgi:hypothetical protein